MEQKYQIGNEQGTIVWDVEAILHDAAKFTARAFSVEELASENRFNGNIEYAMTTDISKPLIIAQLNEVYDILIDGNHRLQKCAREGRETVIAYYLTFEQHSKYIVDFDSDTYWKVVNQWEK